LFGKVEDEVRLLLGKGVEGCRDVICGPEDGYLVMQVTQSRNNVVFSGRNFRRLSELGVANRDGPLIDQDSDILCFSH
jgi:hypothetical protein